MRIEDLERLIGNLPDSPSLEGENEYFNSVVLILLIPQGDGYQLLFEKRASGIRQGGEISFPGGQYDETDGSKEAAAIRETNEELGIPRERIKIIGQLDSVFAPMGALVDVFVGTSDMKLADIRQNPVEVERVFVLPVSYFEENPPEEYKVIVEVYPSYVDKNTGKEIVLLPSEKLGLPERYRKPWGGFRHKVFVYPTPEGTIWGITARIVRDFIKKLG